MRFGGVNSAMGTHGGLTMASDNHDSDSYRCDRCGRRGDGDPCSACEEELGFWADDVAGRLPMQAESVYLTGGRTKRSVHNDPDCSRLEQANKVVEKPASAVPDGYFHECEWCFDRDVDTETSQEDTDGE